MPNAIRNLFLPLYRLAHLPDSAAYRHASRAWMLNRLLDSVDLSGVRTVVEVGCGDGFVSRTLAGRFERVVGFDMNPGRIDATEGQALLVVGSAEQPPIARGRADLVFSLAVLEHVPDRVGTLTELRTLLRPGGVMIHVVPLPPWKVLQWVGFVPDVLRKHTRGVARALTGQRKIRSGPRSRGRETNNPHRRTRRAWYRRFYPRVHGEYDSNLEEFIQWRRRCWIDQFRDAGLSVVQAVPMGIGSPYGFGLSRPADRFAWTGLSSAVAFVLEPAAPVMKGG